MKRGALLLLAAAGCGTPSDKSDWERQHETQLAPAAPAAVKPPAYPRERDLIEFFVAASNDFRFFVDPASVSVHGGEVRYTLVARSSAGARNITYEGMRCNSGEVRLYAVGHDGTWGGRAGEWKAIQPRSVQRWHNALHREYFCPQREAILSPQEGIAALRGGGHSAARGFSDDLPRGGTGR